MAPQGVKMGDAMSLLIQKSFGSYDAFAKDFKQVATKHFGSGWVWVVVGDDGMLGIVSTVNAGTPITENMKVILACDIWEHAYYIDTRNDRGLYVDNFLKVVNWEDVSHLASDSV